MSSGTATRTITATILIPLVVAAIWWGPTWLIAIVTAAVAILALWEFLSIAARMNPSSYRLWTCVAAAGIVAQQYYAARQASIVTLGQLFDRSPRINLEFV